MKKKKDLTPVFKIGTTASEKVTDVTNVAIAHRLNVSIEKAGYVHSPNEEDGDYTRHALIKIVPVLARLMLEIKDGGGPKAYFIKLEAEGKDPNQIILATEDSGAAARSRFSPHDPDFDLTGIDEKFILQGNFPGPNLKQCIECCGSTKALFDRFRGYAQRKGMVSMDFELASSLAMIVLNKSLINNLYNAVKDILLEKEVDERARPGLVRDALQIHVKAKPDLIKVFESTKPVRLLMTHSNGKSETIEDHLTFGGPLAKAGVTLRQTPEYFTKLSPRAENFTRAFMTAGVRPQLGAPRARLRSDFSVAAHDSAILHELIRHVDVPFKIVGEHGYWGSPFDLQRPLLEGLYNQSDAIVLIPASDTLTDQDRLEALALSSRTMVQNAVNNTNPTKVSLVFYNPKGQYDGVISAIEAPITKKMSEGILPSGTGYEGNERASYFVATNQSELVDILSQVRAHSQPRPFINIMNVPEDPFPKSRFRVAVFASHKAEKQSYIYEGHDLGQWLAENDMDLVFGGGDRGVMGGLYNGFEAGRTELRKGDIPAERMPQLLAAMPSYLYAVETEKGRMPDTIDRRVEPNTMSQRKHFLLESSQPDVFVSLKGGIGTYEEVVDFVGLHKTYPEKRMIILNDQDEKFTELLNTLLGVEDYRKVPPATLEERLGIIVSDTIDDVKTRIIQARKNVVSSGTAAGVAPGQEQVTRH
ncbi:MAG: hypothetical protein EB060_04730 [Proteobacteria bacterium]|nr:hypothetical protein [Pseudomonadota bacterium]